MKMDFEQFLMEKHGEQYEGFKDTMIDDFEKWLCEEISPDEWIEYGNEYAEKKIKREVCELLEACKDFVKWFDYISAFQSENLAKGLKEAEDNWNTMTEPSPNIDKMRQAIAKVEAKQ